ncbi:hypothetical protein ACFSTE_04680 [Aquimarina hainanensis]|uniref:Peptidase MA superfamily protein n=1 Tax=Aquimarina hainanensis TaxID=1578017 RepID=A0ABW5N4U5_9FLAO
MNLFRITIISFILSTHVFAQKVTYNHIVDSTDTETKEVISLIENYLNSTSKDQKENPFWNTEEQLNHKNFDFLESEFTPSLYMGFPVHVLSIKFKNDVCQIKVQFSYYKEDGTPYILAIVNYIAKKENGRYKLYNALSHNKQQWNCTTVGVVDFYYPKYHSFNYQKAQKLTNFITAICKHFAVPIKPFEYFLADDYDEIQVLKGIDYYLGMGGKSIPGGKATDDKVYCGGLGEYYVHEVFHLQIGQHFPDKHFWTSEGIATFLGGSRGKDLSWHIKRTNRYLQQHPEIDLKEMLKLTNLDHQTSYHYVLGGLIAKKIWEKGGWDSLKDLMSSGVTDDNYYRAIEKNLEVKRTDLNAYIRAQLAYESKK